MKHKQYIPEHTRVNPISSILTIEDDEIISDNNIKDITLHTNGSYKFRNSRWEYCLVHNWEVIIADADGISLWKDWNSCIAIKWEKFQLFIKGDLIDEGENIRISPDWWKYIVRKEENWIKYDTLFDIKSISIGEKKEIFKTKGNIYPTLDNSFCYTKNDVPETQFLTMESDQIQLWSDKNWFIDIAQSRRIESYFDKLFSTRDWKNWALYLRDTSSPTKVKKIFEWDRIWMVSSQNTFVINNNDWKESIYHINKDNESINIWDFDQVSPIEAKKWYFKVRKEPWDDFSLIRVVDWKINFLAKWKNIEIIDNPNFWIPSEEIESIYVSVRQIQEIDNYNERTWYSGTSTRDFCKLLEIKSDWTINKICEWEWWESEEDFNSVDYYWKHYSRKRADWKWELFEIWTNKKLAEWMAVCGFLDWHYLYKTNEKSSRYFMNKDWEEVCKCYNFRHYRSTNWNYIYQKSEDDKTDRLCFYNKTAPKKIKNTQTGETIWRLLWAKITDNKTINFWTINKETNNIEFKNYLINSIFDMSDRTKIGLKSKSNRAEISQDINDIEKVVINWIKYKKKLLKMRF